MPERTRKGFTKKLTYSGVVVGVLKQTAEDYNGGKIWRTEDGMYEVRRVNSVSWGVWHKGTKQGVSHQLFQNAVDALAKAIADTRKKNTTAAATARTPDVPASLASNGEKQVTVTMWETGIMLQLTINRVQATIEIGDVTAVVTVYAGPVEKGRSFHQFLANTFTKMNGEPL